MAGALQPTYRASWHTGSAWASIANDTVLDIGVDLASDTDAVNPHFIGDQSNATARLTLRSVATFASETWQNRRIRIQLQMQSGTLATVFEGIITERQVAIKADTVQYRCKSYAEWVRRTKVASPLFRRRRAATRTTASSIEDPADGAYQGGIVNYTLWQAGLRPFEQDYLYPTAKGYYSCDWALFKPEWTWLNGENSWDELAAVARAAGGQLYIDNTGTVRFRSMYTPTQGAITTTWTESDYADLSEQTTTYATIDKVLVPWSYRAVQGYQALYEMPETVLIPANSSVDLPAITPDAPVYAWSLFDAVGDAVYLAAITKDDFSCSDPSNFAVTPARNGAEGASVHFEILEIGAQHLKLRLAHTRPQPLNWHKLVLRGAPIQVIDKGNASAGSGTNQFTFEDNAFVSSADHGEQLAEMLLALLGVARPVRTLKDLIYDERRYVGERVNLTSTALGLSAVAHVISKITAKKGDTMDVDLIPVNDLPQYSDLYIWGATYGSTWTKEAVW